MKTWKVRERCLEALAWTPIGICLLLVGWGYWVFTFSVCRYLLSHGHVFQGVIYLVMVSIITVLLIWSYSIASFTSPGYPSEILHRSSGYHSASHGNISMVDQEDGVHVGLLESEQLYLPPSPNGEGSGVAEAATSATTGAVGRSSPLVSEEAFSREASTESSAEPHSPLSLNTPPPLPSLQAVDPRPRHLDHTIVRMTDEGLETAGYGHEGMEDEGDNDDATDNMPLGRSIRRFTVKRDGKMRYCQKCKFEKPDRTHHCSSCKRCVLKMDHHCPWLNNCVGHKNYKAFFLFVFWTAVYCVAIVACTIPVAAEVANLPYGENAFDPQWIFIIFIALIFGLCLIPFAVQHLLLIKSNKTTIESFEKHKYRMGNNGEVMQSRILNVFDLGRKQNFIHVLGPVWYLWLIPVRNSIGDGWSFPANEYGKSMLYMEDDDHSVHSRYTSNYNQWTPSGSSSPQLHHRQLSRSNNNNNSNNLLLTHTQYQQQVNSEYEPFDLNENDTDDADQEHVRRDSDESDDDDQPGGGGEGKRRRQQPKPRRFRQQRGGFPETRNDSDDEEAEEYLYDSDEPATFHFTNTGR